MNVKELQQLLSNFVMSGFSEETEVLVGVGTENKELTIGPLNTHMTRCDITVNEPDGFILCHYVSRNKPE